MSKESEFLIWHYQEQIIQFGLIAMFANVFPLAPLFSFLCNLIDIKSRIISMCNYSRRGECEGASGIGAWLPIMEMLAMVCIPVNTAIIYLTGDSSYGFEGQSSYVKYMESQNEEYWTVEKIIILVVLVEHGLLFIKVVIAALIPDVPSEVIASEKIRPQIIKNAQSQIDRIKKLRDGEVQSLDEIRSDLDRQEQAKTDQIKEELQRAINRSTDKSLNAIDLPLTLLDGILEPNRHMDPSNLEDQSVHILQMQVQEFNKKRNEVLS